MCFLAADGRIYAMDEEWHDTNRTLFSTTVSSPGSATTTLVVDDAFELDDSGASTARGTGENLVRSGMAVLIRDVNGIVVAKSSVSSAVVATKTITLADASTWPMHSTVEVGTRQDLRIVTSFIGETEDNMDIETVQCRYSLHGDGYTAFAKVDVQKTDLRDGGTTVDRTEEPSRWHSLGVGESDPFSMRRGFAEGRGTAPEVAVDITFTGGAQVRVTDLLLEVGGG
jgi:hypothetical protein